MTAEETREHLKEATLAYGLAMQTGNALLIRLAGQQAMDRIEAALPDVEAVEET